MNYNPDIHHRHSIRLREYDYSTYGAYFVTVCVQNREGLFGSVAAGQVEFNDAGRMVSEVWTQLPQNYPGIDVDTHVVMPNHFHGIIFLNVGAAPCGRPNQGHPLDNACKGGNGHPRGGAPTLSLSDVVHRFKSMTTARYRHAVIQCAWPPFPGRLWQRNFYERIIRNEKELDEIRDYIAHNPANWADEAENPGIKGET